MKLLKYLLLISSVILCSTQSKPMAGYFIPSSKTMLLKALAAKSLEKVSALGKIGLGITGTAVGSGALALYPIIFIASLFSNSNSNAPITRKDFCYHGLLGTNCDKCAKSLVKSLSSLTKGSFRLLKNGYNQLIRP